MKHFIYILILCSTMLFSQKKISHTIDINEQLKTVYFTLNSVFDISVHTSIKKEITITAHSEGEYANHFVLNETRTNTTLSIEGNIAFTFPNHQDKLSAHKVHAISVQIWVPENLQVIVQSDIGNVNVSGKYKTLVTDLASGNCFLKAVKGNITASSVSGAIDLKTSEGVVTTQTNLGAVSTVNIPKGTSTFYLKTNKGNITITKI